MRKGVSPVVAIVLLIAIAVIAAVAVWSWVSPLTSKPPTGSTTQYRIDIIKCYSASSSIDIKNTGGTLISGQTFDLYNGLTGAQLNITGMAYGPAVPGQTLAPGAINSSVPLYPTVSSGTSYILRATNFPDAKFTC
jgi:flagellin-like protein